MRSILSEIELQTKSDLSKQRREVTLRDLESMPLFDQKTRDFRNALTESEFSIIAEIKKASPSKGVIRKDFKPVTLAGEYVEGGASAISVLTDRPFFQGSIKYLEEISTIYDIPLLRKDFILDPYQVKEAKAHGADAILLIVTMLSDSQLYELLSAAEEFSLNALVECYSEDDVDRLDWDKIELFGVNNRDLNTFKVDLHRGVELLKKSPDPIIRVSESGLYSAQDLTYLKSQGISSALIGEYFMRQESPGRALSQMLSEMTTKMDSREEDRQYE